MLTNPWMEADEQARLSLCPQSTEPLSQTVPTVNISYLYGLRLLHPAKL